jgi:CRP-like cAMP-binding protein
MCPSRELTKDAEKLDKVLAKFNMFGGMSRTDLVDLAKMAVRRKFNKGETIFTEGQETTGFHLLEKGRIKVFKLSPEGKEHILHIIEPGFSLAEACIFFEERTCPASASALEDCVTIFFPKDPLVEELHTNCSLGLKMLGSMARWVRVMAEQVGSLSLRTVEGRLVNYLVVLAKNKNTPFEDGHVLTLDVEKGVLAARLGTIPETLSRSFKKLQDGRLIKVERSQVTLLDTEGLLEMLE